METLFESEIWWLSTHFLLDRNKKRNNNSWLMTMNYFTGFVHSFLWRRTKCRPRWLLTVFIVSILLFAKLKMIESKTVWQVKKEERGIFCFYYRGNLPYCCHGFTHFIMRHYKRHRGVGCTCSVHLCIYSSHFQRNSPHPIHMCCHDYQMIFARLHTSLLEGKYSRGH